MPKLADTARFGDAGDALKVRIARAAQLMERVALSAGCSPQDILNGAGLLLVAGAVNKKVSFGQMLVLLRADWEVLHGPPIVAGDAAAAARQAGLDDLAQLLEAELGPTRPVRELRGDLRTMRRGRDR
jgi:hypothetical protein